MKVKAKFNYFFIFLVFILPALLSPIGIILFSPLIYSKYSLLPPFWSTVGALLFGWGFIVVIVSYSAIPWLIVIRGNKIVFHRLFRRKREIEYSSIKELEVMGNALSIEDNRWALGNLLFYMKDGTRIFVVAVPYYALIELKRMLKRYGVEPVVTHRKPTEKEREEIKRKVIKV